MVNFNGSGKRSFSGDKKRREMHKAVCSSCGKDCEVPFEPTGGKPVYCSECFEKIGGRADSRKFQDRKPDFEGRNKPVPLHNEQLEEISRKLDKIIEILTLNSQVEAKEIKSKPAKIATVAKKKAKTLKKKTPVIKE